MLGGLAVAFLSFLTAGALVSEEVFDEISIKMVKSSSVTQGLEEARKCQRTDGY